MTETAENTEGLIAFDDILDITMAASYHEKLTEMLNQHKVITLDGGEIERIDGAGLQMLIAFFKAARSLNISVKWQACSDSLKKSADLSGLTGSLEID